MRKDGILRHAAVAFLIALVSYALLYYWIEHRRARRGGWQVTFTVAEGGVPALLISQRSLGLTNVQLQFPGHHAGTNPAVTLTFDQARPVPFPVPFGQCIFLDTTFLPGTVTLRLFEQELELLPRVLVINRKEYPWASGAVIAVETPPSNHQ